MTWSRYYLGYGYLMKLCVSTYLSLPDVHHSRSVDFLSHCKAHYTTTQISNAEIT
jgi:hypothetical protein